MSRTSARRGKVGRGGPAPEIVAAALVVVLYGAAMAIGATVGAATNEPTTTQAPAPPSSVASPSAAIDPLRADISAILEVDARLYQAREDLRAILAKSAPRGSEVAFVLRRIKTTLLPGVERIGRLTAGPASHEVGAQLEIIYADASNTVDRASDLALGSDPAYREAAEDIVDLFTDLPAIDVRLKALLDPTVLPTASATPSGAANPSGRPSAAASAAASTSPPPSAAPSPSTPDERPAAGQILRDPGFEAGLGPWSLRTLDAPASATVRAGAPLGLTGTRSLQVTAAASASAADVAIGQGSIRLEAGRRYLLTLSMRASGVRAAQLRVVGPAEETYAIKIVQLGPTTATAGLEFTALVDDPSAAFWIDLGGPTAGTVWLDDASLVLKPPA